VLECAAGKTNTVVARDLRLTRQTIGKWRTRFLVLCVGGGAVTNPRGNIGKR